MSRSQSAAAVLFTILFSAAPHALCTQVPVRPARLIPLPITSVRVDDRFWAPRMAINRSKTLGIVRQRLLESGAIDNFDIASGKLKANYRGPFWSDSDVYKWLEGAAYSLALSREPALEASVDEMIAKIAAAQAPDGYLNTYFQVVAPEGRWTNLAFCHELYTAGHLLEAAVAHFESTGKRTLLDVAVRNAAHIDATFGPGKRDGQPGHEEIELALVKLARATGEKRFLRLSQFFLDMRGRKPSYFETEYYRLDPNKTAFFLGRTITMRTLQDELFRKDASGKFNTEYSQDHLPVRQQDKVVGHAVRAMYLYSGMADVAAETGEQALLDALARLYRDLTTRRIYVTGGIGPSAHNEGFTTDYDLPNETAYQETCASIGVALWTHRMLALTGEGRYADTMEQALYNAFPAGVSLAGDTFFYDNPLYSRGKAARRRWFSVPCCPTNVVRIMPSVAKFIYGQSDDALWVNLYVRGRATVRLAGGELLEVEQDTDYPWSGAARLRLVRAPAGDCGLHVRIPGWAGTAAIRLNGKPIQPPVDKGYAKIRRRWSEGDAVDILLPMDVQLLEAHPNVLHDRGRVALRRGPVIYAVEQADHSFDIDRLVIPLSAKLDGRFNPGLLGGVGVVAGPAMLRPEVSWEDRLYQPVQRRLEGPVSFTAIPYATWANRGTGKMAVWIEASR